MKNIDEHIRFEVETRVTPLRMFGTASTNDGESSNLPDTGEYKEVTEEDINMLARILGGG